MLRHATLFTIRILALTAILLVPTDSWCQDSPVGSSPDLVPAASEQFCVDDRAMNGRLARFGGQLIDTGKTTPIAELVKQLENGNHPLVLPKIKTSPMSPSELYNKVKDSVLIIGGLYKCNKCSNWHANGATGFVISSTGAVLTNHHVVNSKNKVT